MPDCAHSTVVDAEWPDGTAVRVDVPTCAGGGAQAAAESGAQTQPAAADEARKAAAGIPRVGMHRPALTTDDAVRIATDPRWGMTMDERLVLVGARQFPRLPVFG